MAEEYLELASATQVRSIENGPLKEATGEGCLSRCHTATANATHCWPGTNTPSVHIKSVKESRRNSTELASGLWCWEGRNGFSFSTYYQHSCSVWNKYPHVCACIEPYRCICILAYMCACGGQRTPSAVIPQSLSISVFCDRVSHWLNTLKLGDFFKGY